MHRPEGRSTVGGMAIVVVIPRSELQRLEAEGARAERLLTTSATLSLQNRNLCDYLTVGMSAFFAGKPAPSLLPAAGEG